MQQLKADAYYFREYAASIQHKDNVMSIIVAVVSGGSVTALATLKQFPWIWTTIVLFSQVVGVVMQHRPLRKKIGSIQALSQDIEALYLEGEAGWLEISVGSVKEKDINEKIASLKKRIHAVEKKWIGDDPLPMSQRIRTRADVLTVQYFEQTFGMKNQNE